MLTKNLDNLCLFCNMFSSLLSIFHQVVSFLFGLLSLVCVCGPHVYSECYEFFVRNMYQDVFYNSMNCFFMVFNTVLLIIFLLWLVFLSLIQEVLVYSEVKIPSMFSFNSSTFVPYTFKSLIHVQLIFEYKTIQRPYPF